ncbi:MAG: response regulator transcription factor [Bacteroidetes bacterium]|nr:response regulator transcription factor [Bacteroidota bacterium]
MSKILRIGLVDDKLVNRTSIVNKLKPYKDIDLCFIAINGSDCLDQLKGLPPDKLPHVIFMDLEMPIMDGVQTIQLARTLYPDIFYIVLTVFDDDDKIFEAIKAGAHGYLLKEESAVNLYDAIINAIDNNGAPMSAAIARKTLSLLSRANITGNKKTDTSFLDSLLTDREKEILTHTINGADAKRIASILELSVLTIRKHISNIYNKLHVNSKAQVINLAHKNNWV